MSYVDGFVIPVPKRKLKTYLKMARSGQRLWKKHGAIGYMECVGDDLKPTWGAKSFPQMARVKKGETVVFSFIVFKSRAHRDRVNAKVMKEMAGAGESPMDMPFDVKRMAYGGFKVMVGA